LQIDPNTPVLDTLNDREDALPRDEQESILHCLQLSITEKAKSFEL